MKPRELIAIIIILFLSVMFIVNTERIIKQDKEIQELKEQSRTRIFLQLK